MTNRDIFIGSLFGSKVAKMVPRLSLVQNELQKHVLPPIPFLPIQNEVEIASKQYPQFEGWKADAPDIDGQFFPLSFRRKDVAGEPWYTFPYEPLISISGSNEIIKRKVAKARNFIGTVKEHWSQDDYSITITGTLIGSQMMGDAQECFPRADFEKLRLYCTWPSGLEVRCEPLQLLGIQELVVDTFDYPFTKGENVQAYELKCSSDFTSEILLEIED